MANPASTRLLIGGAAAASGAVWAPDGKRIAYVAPYLGKPQIWVMDVTEGMGKPIAQTEAYYQALQARGVPAMMVRLPEANHGMGRPSQ